MSQQMEEIIEFTGPGGEAYCLPHRSTMSERLILASVCVSASLQVFVYI